jgi:uncharacterized membrane protein YeaQ/YmgE (transglycosylase-associated protein family)
MPVILGIVLVVVAVMIFFSVAMNLVHLLLMLFIAGLVGALADAIVPGRLPYGWLGAIVAGLVGGWLGTLLLGHMGPSIFGVPLLPAFVGAVILAFGAELVGKVLARPRTV